MASIEVFNGTSWKTIDEPLPQAYTNVKAVNINDEIWIIGAYWEDSNTPVTEIRKLGTDKKFDGTAITITPRSGDFQAVRQRRADGDYLVIADGIGADWAICKTVDILNIATGEVTTTELTDERWRTAMIAVPDAENPRQDNVWFIGGMASDFSYQRTVEQLDANGVVSKQEGELNIGRAGASVYWNENLANLIVVGGFTSDHAWKNIPEIAANDGMKWIQCPGTSLPVARIGQHLEVVGTDLNSKRLVLFGGTDLEANYIKETESCIWIEELWESDWVVPTKDEETTAVVTGLDLTEGASYVEEIAIIDANHDGRIDTLEVYFSEAMDAATVASAAWTLEGYGDLTAGELDGANDDHLVFTFAQGSAYDTAALPTLTINGAPADVAGNALVAPQGLVLSDHARPVLVYAKAEGGKIADKKMPEGVTITLTFSEAVKQYLFTAEGSSVNDIMRDFEIRRVHTWEAITDELVDSVSVEDGKIVLSMKAGTL